MKGWGVGCYCCGCVVLWLWLWLCVFFGPYLDDNELDLDRVSLFFLGGGLLYLLEGSPDDFQELETKEG